MDEERFNEVAEQVAQVGRLLANGVSGYDVGRHWNGVHWGNDPMTYQGRHLRLGRYDNGERTDGRLQMWGKHMGNVGYLRGVVDTGLGTMRVKFNVPPVTDALFAPEKTFPQVPDQGLSD